MCLCVCVQDLIKATHESLELAIAHVKPHTAVRDFGAIISKHVKKSNYRSVRACVCVCVCLWMRLYMCGCMRVIQCQPHPYTHMFIFICVCTHINMNSCVHTASSSPTAGMASVHCFTAAPQYRTTLRTRALASSSLAWYGVCVCASVCVCVCIYMRACVCIHARVQVYTCLHTM
jgi:hypothetical protein